VSQLSRRTPAPNHQPNNEKRLIQRSMIFLGYRFLSVDVKFLKLVWGETSGEIGWTQYSNEILNDLFEGGGVGLSGSIIGALPIFYSDATPFPKPSGDLLKTPGFEFVHSAPPFFDFSGIYKH